MNKNTFSIKYGFYGSLIGIVFYVLLLLSGNSPWGSASWMGAWIPGISAFFAIKSTLQSSNEIQYNYYSLFKLSYSTIFYQSLFYNAITYLFSIFISTQALELYKSEMLANAEQIGSFLSSEMYEQVLIEVQHITHSTLAFWDFIYKLIGGLFVSLILAGIFRKNKPVFENQHE